MLGLFFLSALLPSALAAPLALGITFGSGSANLPTLTLPYASYKAYSYDVTDDYYVFKNIRFAAPPVGDLRWRLPADPLTQTGVQDGSVGFQCPQALPSTLSFGYPILSNLEPWSEDCLFLDIQVPGKAIRGEAKDLPVLFWIFGGGYVLGSKGFFLYDGAPLLKSSGNNIIWVAPNYRLGAFGFLGGPTVKAQGIANAAFYDQKKALQWVQNYISLVGGDKTAVTAMGESAGAGSIMHHLVGNRGTSDPLFKRAVLQSPAFEPQSAKKVLDQYTKFEKDSGCAGLGLACLRTKTTAALQNANLAIVADSQYGTFGFGPTIDNTYIYDYPGIEMASGNYWKDVSIIYAHNSEEGVIFADPLKIFNSDVDNLLKANFPNMTTANFNAMTKLYPYPGLLSEFLTNFGRLEQTIGDWVVNCNTRFLAKAYAGKAYGYVVTVPPGVHGLDLFFTFWRTDLNIYDIIQVDIDIPLISDNNLATGLQSYLTSFVRTGNPNTYRQSGALPPTINMVPSVVSTTDKVLNVGLLAYSIGQDDDSRKDRCDFWESGVWTGR